MGDARKIFDRDDVTHSQGRATHVRVPEDAPDSADE
jgi:hypothetical protein